MPYHQCLGCSSPKLLELVVKDWDSERGENPWCWNTTLKHKINYTVSCIARECCLGNKVLIKNDHLAFPCRIKNEEHVEACSQSESRSGWFPCPPEFRGPKEFGITKTISYPGGLHPVSPLFMPGLRHNKRPTPKLGPFAWHVSRTDNTWSVPDRCENAWGNDQVDGHQSTNRMSRPSPEFPGSWFALGKGKGARTPAAGLGSGSDRQNPQWSIKKEKKKKKKTKDFLSSSSDGPRQRMTRRAISI